MSSKYQNAIRVFSDLKKLREHIEKDPENNLIFKIPLNQKSYKGAVFYQVRVTDPDKNDGQTYALIVKLSGLEVPFNLNEIKEYDVGNEKNSNPLNSCKLDFRVDLTGEYGKLIECVNINFEKWVNNMKREKVMGKDVIFRSMIQDVYSDKHPDPKIRNQPKEHPTLKIVIDFSKYSDNHPIVSLRGKPKTEIYDKTTKYVDGNNIIRYKIAEVDGEPINIKNIHKFIKLGSIIDEARIHLETVSKSTMGVSLKQLAGRLVISPSADIIFEGEDVVASEEEIAALNQIKNDTYENDDEVDNMIDNE